MTKTDTLTLSQSLRTYAAVAPTVTVEFSAETARSVARALDNQKRADQERVAIRKYNAELGADVLQARLHYWLVLWLCAAAAKDIVQLLEVLI